MRRHHAISPGFSGHNGDLGISSRKRHVSACKLILSADTAADLVFVPHTTQYLGVLCIVGIFRGTPLYVFVRSRDSACIYNPRGIRPRLLFQPLGHQPLAHRSTPCTITRGQLRVILRARQVVKPLCTGIVVNSHERTALRRKLEAQVAAC